MENNTVEMNAPGNPNAAAQRDPRFVDTTHVPKRSFSTVFSGAALVGRYILCENGEVILLRDYQELAKIKKDQVSKYLGCDHPVLNKGFVLSEVLLNIYDALIEELGSERALMVKINRGHGADPGISSYALGMAFEFECQDKAHAEELFRVIEKVCRYQGFKFRAGFVKFMNTGLNKFHLDVCPEYFGQNRPLEIMEFIPGKNIVIPEYWRKHIVF